MRRFFSTIIVLAAIVASLSAWFIPRAKALTLNVSLQKSLPAGTLNNGLVGHWTFDAPDVSVAGAKIFDMTPTSTPLHGKVNGGTIPAVKGKIGQAGNFNGTSHFLRMNPSGTATFRLRTGLTFVAWVKTTSTDATAAYAGDGAVNIIGDSTNNVNVGWGVTSGKLTYNHYNAGWSTVQSSGTVNDNAWHFVAVTHKSSSGAIQLYIDGKRDGAGTITYDAAGATGFDTIGAGYLNQDPFDGSLDEVRIYSRDLSYKEITQLYQMGGGTGNKTLPATSNLNTGLQGWWTFDGADVNTTQVLDKSGLNKNGTRTALALVSGRIGQGGRFNGSSSLVNPGSVSTAVNSVGFWMKTTSSTTKIIDLNGTASIEVIGNIITANNFTSPTIYVNGVVTSTITMGKWNFIVVTTGTSINASAVTLGQIGSNFYLGFLDDVRIWNRALSAKEITRLYQMGGGTVNTTIVATPNLNTSLVGFWTFDGPNINQTQILDMSGSSNTGTRTAIAFAKGKIGQAGLFNGTNSKVSCGTASSLSNATGTMALWFKARSGQATNARIFEVGDSSNRVGLFINSSNQLVAFPRSGGVSLTQSNTSASVNDNKWHFAAYSWSANKSVFYVDDAIVSSRAGNFSITMPTNPTCYIGEFIGDGSFFFSGSIDDVRYWGRELSAKEVVRVYQLGL